LTQFSNEFLNSLPGSGSGFRPTVAVIIDRTIQVCAQSAIDPVTPMAAA